MTPDHPAEAVRVHRHAERGHYDRATIDAVLDEQRLAHVAFGDGDQPLCIPMLQARIGDRLYVHGSTGSRALRLLATGVPACVTVTMLDGLVLARSAFEHSANYRSVMLLGRFAAVEGDADRMAAFEAFTDKILAGRWAEVRPPTRREMSASLILAMDIGATSAKIRVGPPTDDDSPDAEIPVWAGELPMFTGYGEPRPSPGLRPGIALSDSVSRLI
jgi:hypothetical protein